MFRNRRVFTYFILEILPSFLLGVLVFISILLMFQALRLTEFLLVHGIKWTAIVKIMGYMSISFLPMLFPMSLIFAVLMTYNRLSLDSEIVALKSSGVDTVSLITPAIVFALIMTLLSAQTSYYLAPWGNRQFEVLITQLGNTKAAASIKEGTFSESFFDLVVYANKVDTKTGLLKDLFIYDEKQPDAPLTIVAPEGQIIPDDTHPGHSVLLRLSKGQIHRKTESHTVINFDSYDIILNDPIKLEERKKSPPSLSLDELTEAQKNPEFSEDQRKEYLIEFHKRSALAVACLVFSILGVAFGISTDRRSGKSSGFILAVGFIIIYWVIYMSAEGAVRSNQMSPAFGIWLPNLLFLTLGIVHLKKSWN
ncbi:MAG: LPS export ABC transporter permease LptF [Pseudobdellovibrio sp.]